MYSTTSKCNRIVNDIAKGFNDWTKDVRDLPILAMLESLRRLLLTTYQTRQQFCTKLKDKLCLKVMKNLEKTKIRVKGLEPIYSEENVFEVISIEKTY